MIFLHTVGRPHAGAGESDPRPVARPRGARRTPRDQRRPARPRLGRARVEEVNLPV